MTKRRFGFALIILCAGLAVQAQERVSAYQSTYQVHYAGMIVGSVHWQETFESGRYQVRLQVRPSSLSKVFFRQAMEEASSGLLHRTGPRPHHYQYLNPYKKVDYHYLIDPGRKQISLRGAQDWAGLEGEEMLQDTASQWLALRLALQALDAGEQTIQFPVLHGRKRRLYDFSFEWLGEEVVETPAGNYAAVRLERKTSRGKYAMLIWCAKALDYLPVRVQRTEISDGSVVNVLLESYRQEG